MIKFIADIGSNHNQSLSRAFLLIDEAKGIGCDAVKFQLFRAENLFYPGMQQEINLAKTRELPIDFIPRISEYCKKKNIEFGCTPFDLDAVDMLQPYVDFYKISSFDILRTDLIKKCANTGKPIMISTGYADHLEIRNAIKTAFSLTNELTIFHCISNYPTMVHECRLYNIESFVKLYTFDSWEHIKIGWSDHTVDPAVIYKAIVCGAKVIEFHLDTQMDGHTGLEFNYGHCWDANEMGKIINVVRKGEEAYQFYLDEDYDLKRSQRADPEDGLRPCKELRK